MKPANFDSSLGELLGGPVAIVAGAVVDSLAWKQPVDVATTVAGTLATSYEAGDTVDGYVLAEGDRVLVQDQASGAENGVYVVASAGIPSRAQDADTADEVQGAVLYVRNGTVNAGKLFQNTNAGTVIIDTTALTYEEIAGTVTVAEEDGSPSVSGVTTIEVPNGGLEDDTGGIVSLHYEQNRHGGRSQIQAHGSMGATETFDATNGNVHTGTLDANCVFTLTSPASGAACLLELRITGSGTNTWTWPGTVVWVGGTTPDPPADSTLVVVVLETIDGGTIWLGGTWGGGGTTSPLTTKGDLWGYSTVDARFPVGTDGQVILADSAAALGVSWQNSGRHTHVVGEPFVGDGAQTVFYLANEAELDTVAAYNPSGARVAITQDSTLLDKITFGAAPAAGTGWIDYVPAT